MEKTAYRSEHDLLGNRDVPVDAYYGVHTLRALENFPITGTAISIYPDLVRALASIKLAAARANHELGLLDQERANAIVQACEEVRAGKLNDQFVVDVIQGGAGTSTNMYECQRGDRQPGAGIARSPEGGISVPAPQRTRQHEPVHQRRVSDRPQAGGVQRRVPAGGRHGVSAPRF